MINNFLFQRKSCHRLSHGSCSPSQSSLSNIGQSSVLTLLFFFYLLWSSLNMFSCSVAIHMAQPWFHSKLSRDEAHKLITQHGLIDGYFFFHVLFPTLMDRFYSAFIHICIFSISFIFSSTILNSMASFSMLFICRVFLLRDSQSNPKTFVLSLCHAQRIRHFQIVPVSSVLTLDMFRFILDKKVQN